MSRDTARIWATVRTITILSRVVAVQDVATSGGIIRVGSVIIRMRAGQLLSQGCEGKGAKIRDQTE